MIQLISPEFHEVFCDELDAMKRLRYRVFSERLGWSVRTQNGRESDEFDQLRPHYLLQRGEYGSVNGCVRLLPTVGPNMLADVFPELLDGVDAPKRQDTWESSRFALDTENTTTAGERGLAEGTYELFAGVIEFGLAHNLKHIVTVTDVRLERILRRVGWHLERLGEPKTIGTTRAVAGVLDVSLAALDTVRRAGGLAGPVLWIPALSSVA